MTTTKFILFDADGVLIDSMKTSCEAFNEIASSEFPSLPPVHDRGDLAHVLTGALRASLMRFGLTKDQAKHFFKLHTAMMLSRSHHISAFDDIISAISDLWSGRCAVISSSHQALVTSVLSRSSSYRDNMFFSILGREAGGTKADRISQLLQSLSLPTANAIYVGDMASDIFYSREAGVRVACVGYGYHPIEHLQSFSPDYILPTTQSVIGFITALHSDGQASR